VRYRSFPGKTMLKIAIFFVSLAFLTPQGIARQAKSSMPMESENQKFKITVSADNSEVKTGSDVCVETSLTNTSSHDLFISFAVGNGTLDFDYEVRFEGRDLISAKPLPGRFVGSVEGGELKPNDVRSVHECLNKRYDLSKPGKYMIRAVRGAWINTKAKKIKSIRSNVVTITVVP